MRQKRFRQVHQAEDVGLEHRHVLVFLHLFHRAAYAIAGVVHQHIHAARMRDRIGHGMRDRVLAGHVQRQGDHARILRRQLAQVVHVARGRDHRRAQTMQILSHQPPKAA